MSRRRMMLATVRRVPVSVFWRPTSTILSATDLGTQANPVGGAIPPCIGEITPDDNSTYIMQGSGTGDFTAGCSGPTLPSTVAEIYLRARVRRWTNLSGGRIRVYLNNVLYLDINGVFTGSWVTYTVSIAPSEMSGWSMSPLSMRIVMSGFSNSSDGMITWAEVEFKG